MSAGRREPQPVPNRPGPTEPRGLPPSGVLISASPPHASHAAVPCLQGEPRTYNAGPLLSNSRGVFQGLRNPWPRGASGRLPQPAPTREEGV